VGFARGVGEGNVAMKGGVRSKMIEGEERAFFEQDGTPSNKSVNNDI